MRIGCDLPKQIFEADRFTFQKPVGHVTSKIFFGKIHETNLFRIIAKKMFFG